MTPKEKAKELVYKYYNKMNPDAPDCNISFNQCKQCALIAVDEILESHYVLLTGVKPSIYEYWQEVKEEIEKF